MKISVYAIAKNEAKNVRDWYNSMCEADEICVVDTGSSDETADLLRGLGCKVAVMVNEPFRFDTARNASMNLVSRDADWCVCTDLDERFSKGWRKVLEETIESRKHLGLNSVMCKFITSFYDDGRPMNCMDYWKIHKHGCVHWEAACHEFLVWEEPRITAYVPEDKMWLEHHPDKSKARDYYLPMLERACREERTSRNLFYYGRELMFKGRYPAAIAVLSEYLGHKCSVWNSERAWAMRFLARCLACSNEGNLAVYWYVKAAGEDLEGREALIEYARFCGENKLYEEGIKAVEIALQRKSRPKIFFTEDECWDDTPLHLMEELKGKLKQQQEAKQ